MNRVLVAARMHVAHPLVIIGIPWLVVGISFAVNLPIWALGDIDAQPGDSFTGGLASLYIAVLVVFVQAVTQMFPFALGLSLSRRDFYLGTALGAAVQSAGYGIVLTVLAAVEGATGGWGMRLSFWAPGIVDVGNPVQQFLVYTLPMLACAFLGMGIGVVFKRWGAPGLYALLLGTLLVAGLVAVLTTWRQRWEELGSWFAGLSIVDAAITLPVVLALALAVLSYLGLRRAVP